MMRINGRQIELTLARVVQRRLIVGATLMILSGCGRSASSSAGADPNLTMLTKLYVDHMNARQGAVPKDEAAFKTYIREHGAYRLKGRDATEVDSLFTSTRDHQPLDFVYGGNPPKSAQQTMVIGYERTAIEGKRTVGYRHGDAELIDEAKFQELFPPAAPK